MGGAILLTCLAVRADLGALGMRARNYWSFDSYDLEALYAEAGGDSVPDTRGCYITSATRKDPGTPGHAPAGVETVEVMALVPGQSRVWGVAPEHAGAPAYRSDSHYRAQKARIEDQLVARLEALFPGSTADVVHRESATPVTQTRFTWASEGTGYGLAATPGQFLSHRPGARTALPGFFLCGASTRSRHGIIGALASGQHAARAILRAERS
jgi:phytoene dehydrogenase-like protein